MLSTVTNTSLPSPPNCNALPNFPSTQSELEIFAIMSVAARVGRERAAAFIIGMMQDEPLCEIGAGQTA